MSGEADVTQPASWEALERAGERADQVVSAWDLQSPTDGGPRVVRTPYGEVALAGVEKRTDPDSGVDFLEVRLAGQPEGGDPHFRVVNPPLLVPDPGGPVELRGTRWREDPLAALAEAIGRNGGAMATRRRRR